MRVKFIDVRREFNLVEAGKEKKIFGKITYDNKDIIDGSHSKNLKKVQF